jgi:chromosome segregation ATPase
LELKRTIKEKDEQNKFWEKTNEDLESKLQEVNFQKSDLEIKYNEVLKNQKRNLLEIQEKQNIIFTKENEILKKNEKIKSLLNQINTDKEKVKMMEDQTRMVKEQQKETVQDLKSFERKTHINMQKIDIKIIQMEVENEELKEKLKKKEQEKLDLKNDIKELQWRLDNKELQLNAALDKNGITENESIFMPSEYSRNKSTFNPEFSKKEIQISSDGI